jgi:hypothetical protein
MAAVERKDNSALDIAAGTRIAYLVVDPLGRRSGFDASGKQFKEIPGSAAYTHFLSKEEPGEESTDGTETVDIFQPSKGTYKINISGNRTGTYTFSIRIFSTDGSRQPPIILKGNIQKGNATSAQLVMDPTPNSVPRIIADSSISVQTRPIQFPKPIVGPRH